MLRKKGEGGGRSWLLYEKCTEGKGKGGGGGAPVLCNIILLHFLGGKNTEITKIIIVM